LYVLMAYYGSPLPGRISPQIMSWGSVDLSSSLAFPG
jgi:hypothetical protein